MTESTKILSIRLSKEDKAELSKYITRESLEAILRQIKRGEISINRKGVVIERVNTREQPVNTTSERTSEKNTVIDSVYTPSESVYTQEPDPDGEWVREMAHVLNVDTRTFKKKIEQSVYR